MYRFYKPVYNGHPQNDKFKYFIQAKILELKKTEIGFRGELSLIADQKYCRMLQDEHSAILLTFIKLPFVTKIFVLSFLSVVLHWFYC